MFRSRRILPQAFQIIKNPLLVLKNMYHHVHKVYQRPGIAPFHMVGPFAAFFFHTVFYILCYRIDLDIRPRLT